MRRIQAITAGAVVAGLVLVAEPAFAATVATVPISPANSPTFFADIDSISATDAWAVGSNGSTFNVAAARYNGTGWTVVRTPDVVDHSNPNNSARLTGVDSVGSGTAFAVGTTSVLNGPGDVALALRWNGSAWTRMSVPTPTTTGSQFAGVKAFSGSDVWAVGFVGSSTSRQSLAMHFNGTTWSQSATPSPGTKDNFVTAVDGAASNDVWAVGYLRNLPYGNRIRLPWIMHWNGSSWTQVPSPSTGAGESTYLYDLSVVSATDAWTVGYGTRNGLPVPFVARWNGSAWNSVAAPPLQVVNRVSARTGNDVWVTGTDSNGASKFAHWNGVSWSVQAVPTAGVVLGPIATDPTGAELAAGYRSDATGTALGPVAYRITG
jgi:hypothetical protein